MEHNLVVCAADLYLRMAENIQIYYYVGGVRHAYRSRPAIPRVGDEVRLKTGLYRVNFVVWAEDHVHDYDNHVAIDLVAIDGAKKKSSDLPRSRRKR